MAGAPLQIPLDGDAVVAVRLLLGSCAFAVDVDLQAVVVDNRGRIIDAACHNNIRACGGQALVHNSEMGDCGGGYKELQARLDDMPAAVHMILFLACCLCGGSLQELPGSQLVAEQVSPRRRVLLQAPLANRNGDARASGLLLLSLSRSGRGASWRLRAMWEPLPEAGHFMDCLSQLHRHVLAEIPSMGATKRLAVTMEKGSVLDFPSGMRCLVLAIGCDAERGKADIEAAAALFNDAGDLLEAVFVDNRCSYGPHSLSGAVALLGRPAAALVAQGDREGIVVQLDLVGEAVRDIFCCAHAGGARGFPEGAGPRRTFSDLANPYCRVLEGGVSGVEICRYTMTQVAADVTGIVLGRLRRGAGGRWGFHSLGLTSEHFSKYVDWLPEMRELTQVEPRSLQGLPEPEPAPFWAPHRSAVACAPGSTEDGPGAPCDCILH